MPFGYLLPGRSGVRSPRWHRMLREGGDLGWRALARWWMARACPLACRLWMRGIAHGRSRFRGLPMSSGSWRTTPLPTGWGRLRVIVLARDPVCRWGMLPGEQGPCPSDATEADHLGAPDDHRIEMLRGLCHPHHKKRSDEQGRAAKAVLASLRKLPKEPHPGIIREGANAAVRAATEAT